MSNEEDPRHKAAINRWVRESERKEAKAEALEGSLKKALAAAIKRDKQKVAREFMESKEKDPTGRRALEEMNEAQKNLMMNESNWGSEITGEEEYLKDDEEDY